MKNQTLFAIIMALVMVLSFACTEEEMGMELSRGPDEIVGGSTYTGLPAVGMLVYNGSPMCTGTVVAPRLVVTAAHCVYGMSASRMQFLIGPSINNYDAVLSVASAAYHPSYNSYSISNDIGYLRLSKDAPVAPMKVLNHMDSSFVGEDLLFVGYGVSNGYSNTGLGTKRAVWMPINSVGSTQFSYGDRSRNTCGGDSGGPAFYVDGNGEYYVAGVTSYGDAYCVSYGVDTRVDAYLDFLGLDGDSTGTTPPTTTDPCQGETYDGRCDGKTVIWCESEEIKQISCRNNCGWNASKGYYDCM